MDGIISVTSLDPFSTAEFFLSILRAPTKEKSDYAIIAAKALKDMSQHLPHTFEYFLALLDFDLQNVMAYEERNITG